MTDVRYERIELCEHGKRLGHGYTHPEARMAAAYCQGGVRSGMTPAQPDYEAAAAGWYGGGWTDLEPDEQEEETCNVKEMIDAALAGLVVLREEEQ